MAKIGDRVKTLRAKEEPHDRDQHPGRRQGRDHQHRAVPADEGTLIEIKLDEHHSDLDEFDNVLQFVTEGDETVADYVAPEA